MRDSIKRDREHAWVRLAFVLGVLIYASIAEQLGHITPHARYFMSAVTPFIILFLIHTYKSELTNTHRYSLLGVEVGIIVFVLINTELALSPLIGIFIWLIIGYGFRYSKESLLVATCFTMGGLAVILILNPLFRSETALVVSNFFAMAGASAYLYTLLKRLNLAIDEANAANKAKSQFLANMSHEIRTPLHGVIAMVNLLKKKELNVDEKKSIAIIAESADTLNSMIDDVLDLSRIEAGQLTSKKVNFNIHDIVCKCAKLYEKMAQEKNLKLTVSIHSSLNQDYYGSEQCLSQALNNFISNAIKFTEYGHVHISASLDNNSTRVRFCVSDTGIGIRKELVDSIFIAFTQVDESINTKYAGSGLGTTIAKELINSQDGECGADSEINVGSTFWFTIPYQGSKHNPSPKRTYDLKRKRILFVGHETSPIINMLDSWNCDYTHCSSDHDLSLYLVQSDDTNKPYDAFVYDPSKQEIFIPDIYRYFDEYTESSTQNVDVILINHEEYITSLRHKTIINANAVQTELYDALSTKLESQELQARPSHAQHSIYVVDDNSINRDVLKLVLTIEGFTVSTEKSASKAYENLVTTHYDLLMIDVRMPDIDGIKLVGMIRENLPGHSQTPIIMLTADTAESTRDHCLEAGASSYLTKPCDDDLLIHTIYSLLDINSAAEPPREMIAPEQDSSILDYVKLDKLSSSSAPGFLTILIERMKDSITSSIDHSDVAKPKDLQTHIHNIKGTAAFAGATAIQAEAEALLSELNDGLTDQNVINEKLSGLRMLCADTCSALEDYISHQKVET